MANQIKLIKLIKPVAKLAIFAAFLSPSIVLANEYDAWAKELGGMGKGVTEEISKTPPADYVPRYTDNPPNAKHYGDGLVLPIDPGKAKISDCRNIPETDLYLRQECEGVNLVTQGDTQRPNVTINPKENLVKGTGKIAGDPTETLDKFKWKYPINEDGSIGEIPEDACPSESVWVDPVVRERTCSKYKGAEMFLCEAQLKVNVDPNFNYSCLETKYQNVTSTCNRKLEVVCDRSPDCTTQGVQNGTVQADMHVSMKPLGNGNHALTFGTIANDYWCSTAAQYDRNMTIQIKGVDRINLFSIKHVAYDDWLWIKVNGNIVYTSAQAGGKEFEMYDVCLGAGKCFSNGKIRWGVRDVKTKVRLGPAERSTNWRINLNTDIRPYLKEGHNLIETRTIVSGCGESATVFHLNQYCEPVCHEKWDENTCIPYQKRTGK